MILGAAEVDLLDQQREMVSAFARPAGVERDRVTSLMMLADAMANRRMLWLEWLDCYRGPGWG